MRFHLALTCWVVGCAALSAQAATVQFQVDPARSHIDFADLWGEFPGLRFYIGELYGWGPQATGSLSTSLSGTLPVDLNLAGHTIQFLSGSLLDLAPQPTPFFPTAAGVSGTVDLAGIGGIDALPPGSWSYWSVTNLGLQVTSTLSSLAAASANTYTFGNPQTWSIPHGELNASQGGPPTPFLFQSSALLGRAVTNSIGPGTITDLGAGTFELQLPFHLEPVYDETLYTDPFPYIGYSGLVLEGLLVAVAHTQRVGDANGDGQVGAADYALWAAQFGQTGGGLTADFDGNGSVGAADYALWAANFDTGGPGAGEPVPEPSTCVLALVGWLAIGSWLARRRLMGHA